MRLLNILILVFLLAAVSLGVNLTSIDQQILNNAFNNASESINNITLQQSAEQLESIPNAQGLLDVLAKLIHFVGALFIEVFKAGIQFGKENPQYFDPVFLISLAKWIIILTIIGLAIKPVGYILIFLILGIIWLKEKFTKKGVNNEKETKETKTEA